MMIRTFATAESNSLTIDLPDDMVGKKLEVIAFEVNNELSEIETKKLKPSQLRGFLSKKSAAEIQQQIAQSRDEWDTL